MTAEKQPLHPNGGTPLVESDMPLDELQSVYRPDLLAGEAGEISKIEQGPAPAIAQNGHEDKAG